MAESVRVQAAAKVNLHLRVYDRREDGFHGILSLFQAVSLADSIVIRSLKESDTVVIDGKFDCPFRETTVFKAVTVYRAATGNNIGLNIAVDKRIPAGAGLGGGSSDAAAVLSGLEELLGGGLDAPTLARLGAAIGSDVPFFLNSAAAIVSGRGEIVEPIGARDDFSLVIAFPGFPVPTGWAYGLLDRERPDSTREADPGPEELVRAYGGAIRAWPFANSFEAVVGASRPEIPAARRLMLANGASFSAMSGSGSAVYGLFEGGDGGSRAIGALKASGFEAYAAAPLARCMALD
jgi:4-diphosphocytidyl-2-C-methyl-D-erythritol kinase